MESEVNHTPHTPHTPQVEHKNEKSGNQYPANLKTEGNASLYPPEEVAVSKETLYERIII